MVGCFFCSLKTSTIFFLKLPILTVVHAMERLDELIAKVRDSRRTMENQINGIQDELKKSKEEVAESVAQKVKRSMPPEFKRKGNEKHFKFNEEVADSGQTEVD